MISYGGVLIPQPTDDILSFIETSIPLSEVVSYPDPWLVANPYPYDTVRIDPLRNKISLNTLRWPRGASNWSTCYLVGNKATVDAIRPFVISPAAYNQSVPQTLLIGGGSFQIQTNMYMLPPRPLAGMPDLRLMPLVDERFFWWYRSARIDITPGVTTWAVLYAMITATLGVTFLADAVPAAYLTPTDTFESHYGPLPPLFDQVAAAIGQVIIRDLNGIVYGQAARTALTLTRTNLSQNFPVLAGGTFNFE